MRAGIQFRLSCGLALAALVGACAPPPPPASPPPEPPPPEPTAAPEPEPEPEPEAPLPDSEKWKGVRTARGVLIVCNSGTNHFAVEIAGQSIAANPDVPHPMLTVDGQVVMVNSAPLEEFVGAGAPAATSDQILAAHMQWEADYTERKLASEGQAGLGFSRKQSAYRTPGGVRCLEWQLEVDHGAGAKDPSRVQTYAYLTTYNAGEVIVLSTALTAGDPRDQYLGRLRLAMDGLRIEGDPIDVDVERERAKQPTSESHAW